MCARRPNAPVHILLVAASSSSYAAMEDFLLPSNISTDRRYEVMPMLHRAGDPGTHGDIDFDLEIYEEGIPRPRTAFTFPLQRPEEMVEMILRRADELGLPLARTFPAFRKVVTERVIRSIAKENALFSLITALPDIVPTVLELPWAVGEFATDTAFLTMNQMRMAFLLAGASDRPIGFAQQKVEVAGILAGAFGWRAIARELVGKIPLGGGTDSEDRHRVCRHLHGGPFASNGLYRMGYGYTRDERKMVYAEAYDRGKRVAGSMVERLKSGNDPGSGTVEE